MCDRGASPRVLRNDGPATRRARATRPLLCERRRDDPPLRDDFTWVACADDERRKRCISVVAHLLATRYKTARRRAAICSDVLLTPRELVQEPLRWVRWTLPVQGADGWRDEVRIRLNAINTALIDCPWQRHSVFSFHISRRPSHSLSSNGYNGLIVPLCLTCATDVMRCTDENLCEAKERELCPRLFARYTQLDGHLVVRTVGSMLEETLGVKAKKQKQEKRRRATKKRRRLEGG